MEKIAKRNKIVFVFILLIFIAGCATWTKAGGPYLDNSQMYKAELPWGWMKYKGRELILTRDGIFLENIEIKRLNVDKKLEHTKKKFVKGMLPEDIAKVLIDDISSDTDTYNFQVIENLPATIRGQNGFKLVYTFSNKEGLRYKAIHYGFGYKDWVYSLVYTAAQDYYFEKNIEEFNKVIQSFKFLPKK